uniref:Uncharacterized protein n=1 Tax=Physcomitrium patens TaxID=3218 RepID=A0A2K1JK06_PHYPA|nr:hypothetical protein PHYPA_018989 [Physcomitrium patens]
MAFVWEWLTDAMLWEPYNPALSRASAAPVVVAASSSARHGSSPKPVVSVPAPSVAAGAASLGYNVADLQPYAENSDDNNCPICVISLRRKNAVMLAKCRH